MPARALGRLDTIIIFNTSTTYTICHFPVVFASVSRLIFVQKFSYENEFDLHGNERAGETNFHMKSFARRLVLTQRR